MHPSFISFQSGVQLFFYKKTLFFSVTKVNHIALLELEVPQVSGRSEKHPAVTMDLPVKNLNVTGKMCSVSGWGRLKSGGYQRPHILRTVDVIVPSNEVCGKMLGTKLPWDRYVLLNYNMKS